MKDAIAQQPNRLDAATSTATCQCCRRRRGGVSIVQTIGYRWSNTLTSARGAIDLRRPAQAGPETYGRRLQTHGASNYSAAVPAHSAFAAMTDRECLRECRRGALLADHQIRCLHRCGCSGTRRMGWLRGLVDLVLVRGCCLSPRIPSSSPVLRPCGVGQQSTLSGLMLTTHRLRPAAATSAGGSSVIAAKESSSFCSAHRQAMTIWLAGRGMKCSTTFFPSRWTFSRNGVDDHYNPVIWLQPTRHHHLLRGICENWWRQGMMGGIKLSTSVPVSSGRQNSTILSEPNEASVDPGITGGKEEEDAECCVNGEDHLEIMRTTPRPAGGPDDGERPFQRRTSALRPPEQYVDI